MDGDIDIDFDQENENTFYEEADQMLEDAKSDRGLDTEQSANQQGNDELMFDGSTNGNVEDRDGLMEDFEGEEAEDEELLDFADLDDNVEPLESVINTGVEEPAMSREIPGEHVTPETMDDDIVHGDPGLPPTGEVSETTAVDLAESTETGAQAGTVSPKHLEHISAQSLTVDEGPTSSLVEDDAQAESLSQAGHVAAQVHDKEDLSAQDGLEQHSVQVEDQNFNVAAHASDDAASLDHVDEQHYEEAQYHLEAPSSIQESPNIPQQQDTPTVTGLHPTIVVVQGRELALFPSSDLSISTDYLLEDENLANASIGDLLQSCRVVLGASIAEDVELELGVDDLGLLVGEVCLPLLAITILIANSATRTLLQRSRPVSLRYLTST